MRDREVTSSGRVGASIILIGALVAGVLASPGAAGSRSDDCSGPPVVMRIAGGKSSEGTRKFDVTDGVARRVPILTGRDEPGRTPKERKKLEGLAAKTDLVMYQIFLADFRISRRDVTGRFSTVFHTPQADAGETAVALAVVPSRARGLHTGDVVSPDDEQNFESFTTFARISLEIVPPDEERGFGTPDGQLEVLALDDDSICVSVDFQIIDSDDVVVAALEGVVEVPVVKSKNPSLYFF